MLYCHFGFIYAPTELGPQAPAFTQKGKSSLVAYGLPTGRPREWPALRPERKSSAADGRPPLPVTPGPHEASAGRIHAEPSAGPCSSTTLDVQYSADFLPTMTR